jgi:hypothetical protein
MYVHYLQFSDQRFSHGHGPITSEHGIEHFRLIWKHREKLNIIGTHVDELLVTQNSSILRDLDKQSCQLFRRLNTFRFRGADLAEQQ